ncbi:ribosomal RNA processing protein 1 homolog [Prorops nasuta]|uniref:ribosomal RNA processing protein 1 homolog n=1 Tax=Prorops nasuta TaxID=863751 RepID=UPI0034CD093C
MATLVIAQEIKFARLLASNDKKVRYKVLNNLKKWLSFRNKSSFAFTEADFMRLWKGLFYCMWMSDKPLVQEELAESLSQIIHCFQSTDVILLYIQCTLKTLATEWFGIDHYRLDKFAMLVRRIFRQIFQVCKDKAWDKKLIVGFSKVLENQLLDKSATIGFIMHISEIYWEEFAKISEGNVSDGVTLQFLKPFIVYLIQLDDERQIRHTMQHVFRYLIHQSDIGLDYKEKFEAWKEAGFPCGNIDVMEKEIESEFDEPNESIDGSDNPTAAIVNKIQKPLDPRAGKVDVELPQIPFNAKYIVKLLTKHKFHSLNTTKGRRQLLRLINEFEELANGKMPLGLKRVPIMKKAKGEMNLKKAALRLLKFEQEIYSDTPSKQKLAKKRMFEYSDEENKEKEAKTTSKKQKLNKEESSNGIPESLKKTKKKLNNMHEKLISKSKENKLKKEKNQNTNNRAFKVKESINNNKVISKIKHKKVQKNKLNNSKVKGLANLEKLRKNINNKKIESFNSGSWDISEVPKTSLALTIPIDAKAAVTAAKVLSPAENKAIESLNDKDKSNRAINLATTNKAKTVEKCMKSINMSPKKKVKIVLQRNTAQHTSEYIKTIRENPAIPYDANKKPSVGVLKENRLSSPVNPFYKRF